ncbi:MAG: VapB-type antitoxin [Thermoprotei archaeon]|nr:MAG: VapB-type antitoxin [Thermofilum sp. ex4484_79]RLF07177.1 MAG: VapB-type antitoxin [Thermoprotei archaeon]
MSVVISVRVKREIKEELEKSGVNIAEEVRSYLEQLAWKIRIRRKINEWDEILSRVKPSKKGFSVKSVKEDREGH